MTINSRVHSYTNPNTNTRKPLMVKEVVGIEHNVTKVGQCRTIRNGLNLTSKQNGRHKRNNKYCLGFTCNHHIYGCGSYKSHSVLVSQAQCMTIKNGNQTFPILRRLLRVFPVHRKLASIKVIMQISGRSEYILLTVKLIKKCSLIQG